jgi:mono/diheme cytochrome c family protein
VTLHGSDLYRMNCRGCHGEQGQGAPPEINSVINPVRATSAAAVMERMKTAGMEISRTDAAKLAQQSQGMLLDRLHHGGQDMPAFPHLGDAEVNSLVAYLRGLAGIRGAQQQQVAVREPRVRVGEYIVKSTCHICHNSAGPNPTPQQLYEGTIPPLNTLALRTSRSEFIRKVTHGAPVVMGGPPQLFRGRMPVFYYLSEAEAADVYLYLTCYPPNPWATLDPRPNSSPDASQTDPSPLDPATQNSGAPFAVNASHTEVIPATPLVIAADTKFAALPMLAGLAVITLLGLGLGFTAFELKRLSLATEVGARAEGRMDVANAGAADRSRKHASDRMDRAFVA